MKKYFKYILIIVLLVGIFTPIFKTSAQLEWDDGSTTSPPSGACFWYYFNVQKNVRNNFTWYECMKDTKAMYWNTNGEPIPPTPPKPPDGACFWVSNNIKNSWTFDSCNKSSRTYWSPTGLPRTAPPNAPPGPYIPTGTSTSKYTLLAPFNTELNKLNAAEDKAFGTYLNIMIKIFIGLCAVLAVVMIVMGGIQYMTSELMSGKEDGKHRITEALFGLLIALGSYALLNTINPDLLKTDVAIEGTALKYSLDVPQSPVNGKYGNYLEKAPWDDSIGKIQTLPQYVSLKNSECTYVGQGNCTSTRGLNMSIVQSIQYACKCVMVITGGTEFWLHSVGTSHQPGGSTIDLRSAANGGDPKLDAYLSGGKPLKLYERYPSPVNAYYEGNHWHIGS